MEIDRILAKLKTHRRDIDKAIAALEKLRSVRPGKRHKRMSKSRTPIPKAQRNSKRFQGRSESQEHRERIGIALVPPSKKAG